LRRHFGVSYVVPDGVAFWRFACLLKFVRDFLYL
jgi:hypothetical protein